MARAPRPVLPRHVAGLLLALLVATSASAARWYEHYARAETALAEGRWRDAVTELNDALERRGDSGARVRSYGMKVVAYFPYLKLGIAYVELGQYDAALQAFETEERLGEIRDSPGDRAELERYRERARAQLEAQQNAAVATVESVIQESLAEARLLAGQDHLTDAMEAVSRALAVAPEDPAANALMAELRQRTAAAERRRHQLAEAAALATRGRQALASGDAAAAASLLRQSLAGRDDAAVRRDLATAEAALRRSAAARETTDRIATALADARRLADAGQLDEALARLELVLALDPAQSEAADLRDELLGRQRESALAAHRDQLLADARGAFDDGRWEHAISTANQVLADAPGDTAALELIGRAYRELSRRVLGRPPAENLPPAIRFADLREELADGRQVQLVRRPAFRLSGVVIDASPVELMVTDDHGRAVPATTAVQPVGDSFVTEFRLESVLPPGDTSFAVVTTDAGGLSSRSEYAVRYRRPLARSPLALGGLGLLAATAAAAGLAWRGARRRRLRRRRFNPYIAGAPVLERDLFFGRDALIERILQTVHNNSLLLHGERRIGKTSLLHQLKRRLEQLDDPEFAFFPVYVDLQGTPEERFFATLGEDVRSELAELLADAALGPSPIETAGYGHRELVADLRVVVERLATATPKRVKLVLLIDEVDELNAYDPRINQRLRSLFMKSFAEHLVAVVAGVRIRRAWEKEASPWYNFFEEIEVTAFDREAAAALVRRPVDGVFAIEPAALDAILERSGCRPYPIQKLCMALVNRMYEEGRRTITAADVEAVAGTAAPGDDAAS